MSSTAYGQVRTSKLKLKKTPASGSSSTDKTKKRKRKDIVVVDDDAIKHGGWWQISEFQQITGPVSIEVFPFSYVKALDDGTFTFGSPHAEGEGPFPEEVLTAIRVSDTKVAFKSGYGKYLGVTPGGKLVGRAEAIGALEQFEPVFEGGKLALCGSNQCFLTCKNEDEVTVSSAAAGLDEIIKVRSNAERIVKKGADEEEEADTATELHYVKQFQCFQDKKTRYNPDSGDLDKAKKEGHLHETMLDRRERMKSDRMCK